MPSTPLGRVVATERNPNTPHQFHFWTAVDSPVGIGTIVRVDGTQPIGGKIPRVYGVVVEGFSYTDLQSPMFDVIARASCAVGVVKSHRTLYVSGAALDAVLALRAGERSSVIRIAPRDRSDVHSWYVRLRDVAGHDALWGLVRVEVAASGGDVTARADQVSRWVLAEAAPLAMPDPRWDKMAYGVWNCEQFLRAIG